MSNKPKGVMRLTEYFPTKGERRHTAMVCKAKKYGYKHPGSKTMSTLRKIISTKYSQTPIGLRRLFGK